MSSLRKRVSLVLPCWTLARTISYRHFCTLHSISDLLFVVHRETVTSNAMGDIFSCLVFLAFADANAVQKGLLLIVRASVQQGRTRLTRLHNELYSNLFHAVLTWSCGQAKYQCWTATVTVVVYWKRGVYYEALFLVRRMTS